jgi:hypothetical protein
LAPALNIGQKQILRLEKRIDLLLSTLWRYVEAMGGKRIAAEFPDKKSVNVSGFGPINNQPTGGLIEDLLQDAFSDGANAEIWARGRCGT